MIYDIYTFYKKIEGVDTFTKNGLSSELYIIDGKLIFFRNICLTKTRWTYQLEDGN